MNQLAAIEREVILTIADDESAWHVHTDSARLTRWLLRVAVAWAAQKARNRAGKASAPRDFGRSPVPARGEIPPRPADAQDGPVLAVIGVGGEGAGA
jgi:hypothetical protein